MEMQITVISFDAFAIEMIAVGICGVAPVCKAEPCGMARLVDSPPRRVFLA
jgi:hypothetical protein